MWKRDPGILESLVGSWEWLKIPQIAVVPAFWEFERADDDYPFFSGAAVETKRDENRANNN